MDPNLLIGEVLGSTYKIERRLGLGAMGAVFVARHLRTNRAYAAKVLLPDLSKNEEALARFQREAESVGSLGHAGIVAIHDFDQTEEGLAYIVMDLLVGEDLENRLKRYPAGMAWDEAFTIFDQVGNALGAAHDLDIVHRDLKPANVFLATQQGTAERAVLLDFGLAKVMSGDPAMIQLTQTGVVMGTPQYMSPEQANGEPVGHRTDIFALAAVFYEILSGQPPFNASTMAALFAQLLTDEPRLLSRRCSKPLPAGIDEVFARALAKKPDDRFARVIDFVEAVKALGPPQEAKAPTHTVPAANAINLAAAAEAGTMPSTPTPPIDALQLPSDADDTDPLGGFGNVPANHAPASDALGSDAFDSDALNSEPFVPAILPASEAPSIPSSSMGGQAESVEISQTIRPTESQGLPVPSPKVESAEKKPRKRLGLFMVLLLLVLALGAATGVALWFATTSGADEDPGPIALADAGQVVPDIPVPIPETPIVDAAPQPVIPAPDATPILRPVPTDAGPMVPPQVPDAAPTKTDPVPTKRPPKTTKNTKTPVKVTAPEAVSKATKRLTRGDFQGCLRELRSAPATRQVIGMRLTCAKSSGNTTEYRRACELARKRYPNSIAARSCGLFGSLPLGGRSE